MGSCFCLGVSGECCFQKRRAVIDEESYRLFSVYLWGSGEFFPFAVLLSGGHVCLAVWRTCLFGLVLRLDSEVIHLSAVPEVICYFDFLQVFLLIIP